jgi:hypothetical protein
VKEAEALELMSRHFLDEWPALQPGLVDAVTFDNEVFEGRDTWLRVSFVHTVRVQQTMGSQGGRKFESRGYVFVQLFGPTDVGVKQLAELADDVREVFEGRRLADELTTYAGSSREGPSDGRWATRTVTIPFIYEELR